MIKFHFKSKQDDHNILCLGLSHINLDKLKAGMPISINVKEMGNINIGEIFIFAGETEEKILDKLESNFKLDISILRPHHDEL